MTNKSHRVISVHAAAGKPFDGNTNSDDLIQITAITRALLTNEYCNRSY